MTIAILGMACAWGKANGVDSFLTFLRQGRQTAGRLPEFPAGAVAQEDRVSAFLIAYGRAACLAAGLAANDPLAARRVAVIVVQSPRPFLPAPDQGALARVAEQSIGRLPSGAPAICNSVPDALAAAAKVLGDRTADAVLVAAASLVSDPEATAAPSRFSSAFDIAAAPPPTAEGVAALVLGDSARVQSNDTIAAHIAFLESGNDCVGALGLRRAFGNLESIVDRPISEVGLVGVIGTREALVAEAVALAGVFPQDARGRALACVRATVGETGAAADLGALIQGALCLRHRILPAMPNWTAARPINLRDHRGFEVPTRGRHWSSLPGRTLLAAMTLVGSAGAFGLVAMKGADTPAPAQSLFVEGKPLLFPIPGVDSSMLRARLIGLTEAARNGAPLSQLSRDAFMRVRTEADLPFGLTIAAKDKDELEREADFVRDNLDGSFASGQPIRTPNGTYFTPRPLGPNARIAFVYPGSRCTVGDLNGGLFADIPASMAAIGLKMSDRLVGWFRTELANAHRAGDEDSLIWSAMSTAISLIHTRLLVDKVELKPNLAFGFSVGEINMRAGLGQWPDLDSLFERMRASIASSAFAGEMTAVRAAWGLPPSNGHGGPPVWQTLITKASVSAVEAAIAAEPRAYLLAILSPNETLIGGAPTACQNVLRRLGSPATLPHFATASHSPIAAGQYERLTELGDNPVAMVEGVDFYSAAEYAPVPQERSAIARSIANVLGGCVDFPKLVRRAYDDGARVFIEAGVRNNCCNWIAATLGERRHLAIPLDIKGVPSDLVWRQAIAMLYSHRVRFIGTQPSLGQADWFELGDALISQAVELNGR